MVPRRSLSAALFLLTLSVLPARAAHFDVIYADQLRVSMCGACEYTIAGPSFVLFVNKGPFSVSAAEFLATDIRIDSSRPGFTMVPVAPEPGSRLGAIRAGEAIGSVGGFGLSLLARLSPGEIFRDLSPLRVLSFRIERTDPSYEGPVTFDVRMQTGAEIATFRVVADMRLGAPAIRFLSTGRASSRAGVTPTLSDSWGTIKQLYR